MKYVSRFVVSILGEKLEEFRMLVLCDLLWFCSPQCLKDVKNIYWKLCFEENGIQYLVTTVKLEQLWRMICKKKHQQQKWEMNYNFPHLSASFQEKNKKICYNFSNCMLIILIKRKYCIYIVSVWHEKKAAFSIINTFIHTLWP